ncbi:MAG: 4Fe-4S binding protein [Acidobacteria bacterium]|nr:4Fe-4S binding protein [Acidobacteriota bacterium]
MAYKWVPIIAEERCTGCGLCVEACGPKCLEMVEGFPVLARVDDCGSEEHCIAPCKEDAIHMSWESMGGNRSVGRWLEVGNPRRALGLDDTW